MDTWGSVFPYSAELENIMYKHWHMISCDPSLKSRHSLPRFVYKEPPNHLVRHLVTSYLPSPKTEGVLTDRPPGNY